MSRYRFAALAVLFGPLTASAVAAAQPADQGELVCDGDDCVPAEVPPDPASPDAPDGTAPNDAGNTDGGAVAGDTVEEASEGEGHSLELPSPDAMVAADESGQGDPAGPTTTTVVDEGGNESSGGATALSPYDERGVVYPAVSVAADLAVPFGSTPNDHQSSVGLALEGQIGITPFARLGGFFRFGYGGLSGDALPQEFHDNALSKTSLRLGPQVVLATPVLAQTLTPFVDLKFGYYYAQVSDQTEVCTTEVSDTGEEVEECESEVNAQRVYEAMTFGVGGGLAFELQDVPPNQQGTKLFFRGMVFFNDWLDAPIAERAVVDVNHFEGSFGLSFW